MQEHWNSPVHPGEILAEELDYIGMSAGELADKIGVPKNRLYQIIRGMRGITADTALRLGVFFKSGAQIWLNLQKNYELDRTRTEIEPSLKQIIPYHAPSAVSERPVL